jgi:hypothetical protein
MSIKISMERGINPKPEIRSQKEIRIPKSEIEHLSAEPIPDPAVGQRSNANSPTVLTVGTPPKIISSTPAGAKERPQFKTQTHQCDSCLTVEPAAQENSTTDEQDEHG